MAEDIKFKVAAEGIESVTKGFESLQSGLSGISGNSLKVLGNLNPLTKGFLLVGSAVVGAGTAIFEFSKHSAELIEQTAHTATAVGAGVEEFSKLSYALGQAGVSADTQGKVIGKLTNVSKEQIEAFKELGISVDNVDGKRKSSTQLINEYVKANESVSDPVTKAAYANKIFGKSAKDLGELLDSTNEEFEKFENEADKFGLTISEKVAKRAAIVSDQFDSVAGASRGLTLSVGDLSTRFLLYSGVLPAIADVTSSITGIFRELTDYLDNNTVNVFGFLSDSLGLTAEVIITTGEAFYDIFRVFTPLGIVVTKITDSFGGFSGIIASVSDYFSGKFNKAVSDVTTTFSYLGKGINATIEFFSPISQTILYVASKFDFLRERIDIISKTVSNFTNIFSRVGETIRKNFHEGADGVQEETKKISKAVDISPSLSKNNESLSGSFAQSIAIISVGVDKVKDKHFKTLKDYDEGIVKLSQSVARKTGGLTIDQLNQIEKITAVSFQALGSASKSITSILDSVATIVQNRAKSALAELEDSNKQASQSYTDLKNKLTQEDADAKNLLNEQYKQDLANKKDQFDQGLITEQEYYNASNKLFQDSVLAQQEQDASFKAKQAQADNTEAQRKKDYENNKNEIQYKADLEAFNIKRVSDTIKITTETLTSAFTIFTSVFAGLTAATAGFGAPAALAVAGTLAALVGVAGAAQLSALNSTPAPRKPVKLEQGGVVNVLGSSHAQGGVNANLEGGELVVSRDLTSKLSNATDIINEVPSSKGSINITVSFGGAVFFDPDSQDKIINLISPAIEKSLRENLKGVGV